MFQSSQYPQQYMNSIRNEYSRPQNLRGDLQGSQYAPSYQSQGNYQGFSRQNYSQSPIYPQGGKQNASNNYEPTRMIQSYITYDQQVDKNYPYRDETRRNFQNHPYTVSEITASDNLSRSGERHKKKIFDSAQPKQISIDDIVNKYKLSDLKNQQQQQNQQQQLQQSITNKQLSNQSSQGFSQSQNLTSERFSQNQQQNQNKIQSYFQPQDNKNFHYQSVIQDQKDPIGQIHDLNHLQTSNQYNSQHPLKYPVIEPISFSQLPHQEASKIQERSRKNIFDQEQTNLKSRPEQFNKLKYLLEDEDNNLFQDTKEEKDSEFQLHSNNPYQQNQTSQLQQDENFEYFSPQKSSTTQDNHISHREIHSNPLTPQTQQKILGKQLPFSKDQTTQLIFGIFITVALLILLTHIYYYIYN